MSGTDADKPKTQPEAAPQRASVTPPPAARGERRATTQMLPASSTDAFALPSDTSKPIEPEAFLGTEPAIFGGVNPIGGAAGLAQPGLPPDPTAGPAQESVPDDDELPPRGAIINGLKALAETGRRSSVLLILAFFVVGILGASIVSRAVRQEVYVSTVVQLAQGPALTKDEAQAYVEEVTGILRSIEVRNGAVKLLRQRAPRMSTGFLGSGNPFLDSSTNSWLDAYHIQLRVDSEDPDRDQVRLQVAAEAFIEAMKSHEQLLKDKKQDLANLEVHLQTLQKQQQEQATDTQGPESGEKADFKAQIQKRIEAAKADVARARRAIDVWPHAEPNQTVKVAVSDNRPLRSRLMTAVWAACVAIFGGAVVANERRKQREAWERRPKRPRKPETKPEPKA